MQSEIEADIANAMRPLPSLEEIGLEDKQGYLQTRGLDKQPWSN